MATNSLFMAAVGDLRVFFGGGGAWSVEMHPSLHPSVRQGILFVHADAGYLGCSTSYMYKAFMTGNSRASKDKRIIYQELIISLKFVQYGTDNLTNSTFHVTSISLDAQLRPPQHIGHRTSDHLPVLSQDLHLPTDPSLQVIKVSWWRDVHFRL